MKTDYITLMSDTATEDRQFVSDICFELQEINEILQCAQAHVGYRVRDEIIFYMLNNKKAELLDTNLAFDNEIMQKILPRIQEAVHLLKTCSVNYLRNVPAIIPDSARLLLVSRCRYMLKQKIVNIKNQQRRSAI